MSNLIDFKKDVQAVIDNCALTHEQAMMNLSSLPLHYVEFFETTSRFRELTEAGILCTMSEGNGTYAPRYILPDYGKLMREGCKFLRLDPPTNLWEAVTTLEIFYRHIPSVTHFPVYLGSVDKMLEPFIEDEEEARKLIRHFLIFLDRTISDSYCHMNLGPEATRAGRMIVEIEKELCNAIPSITLLYDPAITPDDFARSCVECALACAKPSFANHREYSKLYQVPYGIASCYNALPVGGGAFTLSRIVLSRLAEQARDSAHLIDELLPEAVEELCGYMEKKITFLVEQTHFFKSSFLVQEGFVSLDRFTGMFGMVGMNECVNILMAKEGRPGTYGHSQEADDLAKRIMEKLTECVARHRSRFCHCTDHRFTLHAQVGISEDYSISPGVRIAIGDELPLHAHLRHCGQFHPYFTSGVGDIFPFDETAKRNPDAIVDLIKGGFSLGMRYFSTYGSDADVIRITGYLVKKSDIAKLDAGVAVQQANATWGLGEVRNSRILERKVRSLT
ncbi:MAG: YjjI family glycine radical enzyme [Oscillospiraceae bacterium]|nr:YjjI family glycine radical enzyme [Oscillospiraceae bacterium]MBQ9148232.1 YjjI family glycine radical enzyme [Oscillospiraceae bacterium]